MGSLSDEVFAEAVKFYIDKTEEKFEVFLLDLLEKDEMPKGFWLEVLEFFLRRDEFVYAGKVVKVLERPKHSHPLVSEMIANYWWCVGEREKAIKVTRDAFKEFDRPYLMELLETFENWEESEEV